MNTPTHLAAAGVVCEAVMYADAKSGDRLPRAVRPWVCALVGVALGAASHLLLDALPHYNWIVYLSWFSGFPYHWLIREALFGGVVFAVVLYLGRGHWLLVCLIALAAMYPDFEKVAYIDFGLPRQLVIFRSHSLQLSGNDWGLSHPLLISVEISFILIFLAVAYMLSKLRAQKPILRTRTSELNASETI